MSDRDKRVLSDALESRLKESFGEDLQIITDVPHQLVDVRRRLTTKEETRRKPTPLVIIPTEPRENSRGTLKEKGRRTDGDTQLEARVLELAGDLRSTTASKRIQLVALLAQELGLSAKFAEAAIEKKAAHFPEKAPELWADRRKDSCESPADFIIRVYGRWIKKGFARPDLRRLDASLYQAFAKWSERHPVPAKLEQFSQETRSGRVERELKELNIREPADAYKRLPDDLRRANRLYQAALRRHR